jgi:hypothetical protein
MGKNILIVDNWFSHAYDGGYISVLAYSTEKVVFERNLIDHGGDACLLGMGVKQSNDMWSIRDNRVDLGLMSKFLYADTDTNTHLIDIELSFNLIKIDGNGSPFNIGQSNDTPGYGPYWSYRNTYYSIGGTPSKVYNAQSYANAPIKFENDIHVTNWDSGPCTFDRLGVFDSQGNPGGSGQCYNLVFVNLLEGPVSAGILDSNGNLQGAWRTNFLGTRGYELGEGGPSPTPTASSTPSPTASPTASPTPTASIPTGVIAYQEPK